MNYICIQNELFANFIVVFCWSNPIWLSAVQVKTSSFIAFVTVIFETFSADRFTSSPLRCQVTKNGGSPLTLQIILMVSP